MMMGTPRPQMNDTDDSIDVYNIDASAEINETDAIEMVGMIHQ